MQIGKYYIFVGWRNIYERNQKTFQWYPYEQNRDQFPFRIYVSCIKNELRNHSEISVYYCIFRYMLKVLCCTNTYLIAGLFKFYNMSNMTRYIWIIIVSKLVCRERKQRLKLTTQPDTCGFSFSFIPRSQLRSSFE